MTPKIWPVGTLQRSLADAAQARMLDTAVAYRDLGTTESRNKTYAELPFVVVTAELAAFLRGEPVPAEVAEDGPYAVFEGERAVRAMNAEAQADFLDQLAQGGHVERVPTAHAQAVLSHDDREAWIKGADADDWDVDDGPANDPEALAAETAAEDAILTRAAATKAHGRDRRESGFPYHVHNPFTGTDTWFPTFAHALAYASAASHADTLDGDLGVWSTSGFEEYRLFKGGQPWSEA